MCPHMIAQANPDEHLDVVQLHIVVQPQEGVHVAGIGRDDRPPRSVDVFIRSKELSGSSMHAETLG